MIRLKTSGVINTLGSRNSVINLCSTNIILPSRWGCLLFPPIIHVAWATLICCFCKIYRATNYVLYLIYMIHDMRLTKTVWFQTKKEWSMHTCIQAFISARITRCMCWIGRREGEDRGVVTHTHTQARPWRFPWRLRAWALNRSSGPALLPTACMLKLIISFQVGRPSSYVK
jgi:hypothetical protein